MLKKLKYLALTKLYPIARKKGVSCPQCSKSLLLPAKMPEAGLDAMFSCTSCGWSGVLMEVAQGVENRSEHGTQQKPEKSKIERSMSFEGELWLIPASKRLNFFWFFSLFWLAITGFITGSLITEGLTNEEGEVVEAWFGLLFLIPFWLVGIGTFYAALRTTFGYFSIVKNHRDLIVRRHLFGRQKEKRLALENIRSILEKSSYSQNDRPVYEIRILAKEGKDIKFGSSLSKEERGWMISQLREACKLVSAKPASNKASNRIDRTITVHELEEIDEKHLKLTRMTGSGFRIIIYSQMWKFLLLAASLFLVVSLLMLGTGVIDLIEAQRIDGWEGVVADIFSFLPLFFGITLGIVGLILFCFGITSVGRESVFEFGEDTLIYTKGKRGGAKKKVRYRRSSFTGASLRKSGHVNNEARYSLTLQGENGLKVHGFAKEQIAHGLEKWILHWLQEEQKPSYGSSMKVP